MNAEKLVLLSSAHVQSCLDTALSGTGAQHDGRVPKSWEKHPMISVSHDKLHHIFFMEKNPIVKPYELLRIVATCRGVKKNFPHPLRMKKNEAKTRTTSAR